HRDPKRLWIEHNATQHVTGAQIGERLPSRRQRAPLDRVGRYLAATHDGHHLVRAGEIGDIAAADSEAAHWEERNGHGEFAAEQPDDHHLPALAHSAHRKLRALLRADEIDGSIDPAARGREDLLGRFWRAAVESSCGP